MLMKEGDVMANEPVKYLSGANGQLYVYEDHLEIHRKGMLAKLSHIKGGCTIIGYYDLAKVKMRSGMFPVSGYMYFERKGSNENVGLIAAARHPDCIVFRSHENAMAREISKYLKNKKGKGDSQAVFKEPHNNKDVFRIVASVGMMALLLSLF